MSEAMKPRVDKTHFDPLTPPDVVTLWFCPACGNRISGTYNLEPARKRCTKIWHLAEPVKAMYVRHDGEVAS